MEEKIYYQDVSTTVTQTRFITGGKTYAMRNISSVQMGTIPPNNTFYILGMLVGIIMLMVGGAGVKIAGVAIIALLVWLMTKNKPKYTVRINSNSGEVDGLVSDDRSHIENIINQINNAIIAN